MSMPKNFYALLVEPEQTPRAICLKGGKNGLRSLQEAVGGYVEAVYPFDDPVAVICNEEGKLNGLPLNRALRDEDGDVYDIISGSFLVVGLSDDDFDSLSPELLVRYAVEFAIPEMFRMSPSGGIQVCRMR